VRSSAIGRFDCTRGPCPADTGCQRQSKNRPRGGRYAAVGAPRVMQTASWWPGGRSVLVTTWRTMQSGESVCLATDQRRSRHVALRRKGLPTRRVSMTLSALSGHSLAKPSLRRSFPKPAIGGIVQQGLARQRQFRGTGAVIRWGVRSILLGATKAGHRFARGCRASRRGRPKSRSGGIQPRRRVSRAYRPR